MQRLRFNSPWLTSRHTPEHTHRQHFGQFIWKAQPTELKNMTRRKKRIRARLLQANNQVRKCIFSWARALAKLSPRTNYGHLVEWGDRAAPTACVRSSSITLHWQQRHLRHTRSARNFSRADSMRQPVIFSWTETRTGTKIIWFSLPERHRELEYFKNYN